METRSGWRREPLPFADFEWCSRFAKLVANSTQQRVDATSPLALRISADRRARADRAAARNHGGLRGHRDSPPGRRGLEHRGIGAARDLPTNASCESGIG